MRIQFRTLTGALLAATTLPAMAHDNGLLHAHPEYAFLLIAAALAVAWFDTRARRQRALRSSSEAMNTRDRTR